MTYREYRRVALPIGSGVTEAACKTIVNYRFKQSGMRLHATTGQHVLDLRVIEEWNLDGVYQTPLRSYTPSQLATPADNGSDYLVFPAFYRCSA